MKPNIRVILVLAATLIVAGAVFRQEKEMDRLRAMIAELTSLPRERAAISTVTNPLPAEFEELRREVAEVHSLRAEIAQLRREKVEMTALQARIDKLVLDVSENLNRRSDFTDFFGDSNRPTANTSPLVLQASSLAQSSPEEAARWVAALQPGKDQDQAALAVIDRWIGTDPSAAASWTTQFGEGPLREQAMSVVARQWGTSRLERHRWLAGDITRRSVQRRRDWGIRHQCGWL
ncbi:MAG TPA: hypothetical protein VKB46_28925 [Pyrinomonadaceae bacterium]|nr:hypothetical protein [Pyrinomonadaceae bacterium]